MTNGGPGEVGAVCVSSATSNGGPSPGTPQAPGWLVVSESQPSLTPPCSLLLFNCFSKEREEKKSVYIEGVLWQNFY